jgi:hypothetical protein
MNHWQRQWLSDRLHKKNEDPPLARTLIQKTPKPNLQAAKAKKAAKNPPKDNTEA